MGKVCSTAIGAGVAGAIIGICAYSMMSPKDQRHIQRGLKNAVDDLKEVADRLTDAV